MRRSHRAGDPLALRDWPHRFAVMDAADLTGAQRRQGGLGGAIAVNGPATSADDEAQWWSTFAGAEHAAEFCQAWLALQCRMIPGVVSGLLLLEHDSGSFTPVAIWPDPRRDMAYLVGVAERALNERRGLVERRDDGGAQTRPLTVHVAYPLDVGGRLFGVVVVDVRARPDAELQAVLRHLHWGAGWLEALMRRRQAEADARSVARAGLALDMVAVVNDHRTPRAATTALATELVSRFVCDRVAIGLERNNRIRLGAMSHSAWFQEKTRLVATIENAMEEALDQHASVVHPPIAATERRITAAHKDFAEAAGLVSAMSAVMLSRGRPVGVITFEREQGEPFGPDDLEMAEVVAAMVGPVVEQKIEARRLIGGRLVDGVSDTVAAVVGPRRPALKLATAAVVATAAFLAFAEGDHRVSAKSVIEGAVQRAAVAPFDGYLADAPVRAGDTVAGGQIMATLDDKDLKLEAQRLGGEREQHLQKYRDALAKHDRATVRVLAAEIAATEAQLALIEERLARSRIAAPFDGLVVSGDLSQMLGSPVEKGKLLFEVAPLDAYRVIIQVDERDIRWLNVGQRGQLALAGLTGERLDFTVRKITPVATAEEGRTFFRIEARLEHADPRLRPGMQGVAKVVVGERRLLWIWTHALTDWLRLTAWTWLP